MVVPYHNQKPKHSNDDFPSVHLIANHEFQYFYEIKKDAPAACIAQEYG